MDSVFKFCGVTSPDVFSNHFTINRPGSARSVSAQNRPDTSSVTASRRDAGAPAQHIHEVIM